MKRTTRIITSTVAIAAVIGAAGATYAVAADDSQTVDAGAAQRASDAALAETGGGTVIEVEEDDGGYDVDVQLADGSYVEIELGADFAVTGSEPDTPDGPDDADDADDGTDDADGGTDDADDADDPAEATPLAEADRQKATDAAIAAAGGGTVTDVERDGTGFEVEVRLDDGKEMDVDLAADFSVVSSTTDD